MSRTIRRATLDDCSAMIEIYRPSIEASCASFELETPTVGDFSNRLEQALVNHEWLVMEIASAVVGYAYGHAHRARAAYQYSVETSVYIHRDFHSQGIGRQLYTELLHVLAGKGFHNAYAGITLPNPASIALHESLGFEAIGVFREVGYKRNQWHDVGWWQLSLAKYVKR